MDTWALGTTDKEFIVFSGMEYPIRRVEITDENDESNTVIVATEHLKDALTDENGEFVNEEAASIDEEIFCYVEAQALEMPDDVLASIVERDYYDVAEETIYTGKGRITLNSDTVFALMRIALRGRGNLWDDAACMTHYIEKDGIDAEKKVAKDEMAKLDKIVHGSGGWDDVALLNAALAYQVVLRIHSEVHERVKSRPRRKAA